MDQQGVAENKKRMNPSLVSNDDGTYQEGTGTIGGWEKSDMRAYMQGTILPLIPENVRSRIVSVTKLQGACSENGAIYSQTTEDKVWIPSSYECFNGGIYYSMLKNTNSINKKTAGTATFYFWFFRNEYSTRNFYGTYAGKLQNYNSSEKNGIALCFCT